ncbi:MAG: class I SAM-dependent methyltransferase [Chloroflexi bacterium]|nr:class I SAM-dependent methyltransferase [Chloroflexota bacterium]
MSHTTTHDPSVVFDRAASYYDRTRTESPEIATALTNMLIEQGALSEMMRVLEVGVGTGRITIPLLRRGINVIGVDMSLPMMRVMRAKQPDATVAQANATQLPFRAESAHAVILSHVLHLIAGWERALYEVQRVLKPGGKLLHCWQEHNSESAGQVIISKFFELVRAHGGGTERPGVRDRQTLIDFGQRQGWQSQTIEVAIWASKEPLSTLVERFRLRQWSSTWQIADDVFAKALLEWERWLKETYGNDDQPLPHERRIMLDVVLPQRA